MPPRRGWVLQNVGTRSFVTHTEASMVKAGDGYASPVCLVWDSLQGAKDHATALGMEYARNRPHLRPIDRMWRALEATPEQLADAFAAGAYGPDYASIIRQHTEQFRSRDLTPEVESFRERLDQEGTA